MNINNIVASRRKVIAQDLLPEIDGDPVVLPVEGLSHTQFSVSGGCSWLGI
jgi:hypothetical protein